jgi:hypothetical protein
METQTDTDLEETCLCVSKVPKDARIDFIQWVVDPDTKLGKWKTVMRAHKDCPDHGIEVSYAEGP